MNETEAEPQEPNPEAEPRPRRAGLGAFSRRRFVERVVANHGLAFLAGVVGLAGVGVAFMLSGGAWSSRAETSPEPASEARDSVAALETMGLCDKRADGGPPAEAADAAAATTRVVSGRLDGRPLAEILREKNLRPTETYRIRQAFAGIDGFGKAGRFVASLDASGAVATFELVVSATEVYRAGLDAAGRLAGARISDRPATRPCFGAFRFGPRLAASLDASPFDVDILDALAAAFGGRADLEHPESGAGMKVITREIIVAGAFAGYDGVVAAEYQPANSGVSPVRVYGFDAESEELAAQRAAVDARLATLPFSILLPPAPDPELQEDAEPVDDESSDAPDAGSMTVAEAAKKSCSTRSVAGLSRQIIAEMRCLDPDSFTRIPPRKNLAASSHVYLYLERPARDRLLKVLDAYPDRTMTVNSALRTIAQQVLLSKWGERQRCGVRLAASPGESNHESGLALDIQEASTWRKALEKEGFRWFGPKDPVHFDYDGKNAEDHRGLDVRAFQRLWTRNHPEDAIDDDGEVTPGLLKKIGSSPAGGFPIGARCDG